MAENERKPTAEVNQSVKVRVQFKRSLTRQQSGDRNYKILYSGRYILNRNINGIKQIIDRNFRKLW